MTFTVTVKNFSRHSVEFMMLRYMYAPDGCLIVFGVVI